MSSSKNIVKLKKGFQINIGVLIFCAIIFYLAGSILYGFSKKKINMYEVQEENLAQDLTVNGIITREESIYLTPSAGYLNYYLRSGSRLKKGSAVYSIDANRTVYDLLGASTELKLTEEDMKEIKRMLAAFEGNYDGNNFSSVYELKENIMLKGQELSDWNLLDNMQDIIADTGITNSLTLVKADCTGLLTYQSDSLDGLTLEQITSASFQQDQYTSASLRTAELVAAGSPAYKLITSDQWNITCLLTMDQYMKLQTRTSLKVTIQENDFTFTAPVTFFTKGSDYYMNFAMNRYIASYLDQRFLTVDIQLDEKTGLKIPESAILTKEFYLIPNYFFTTGGDSNESGLVQVNYDSQTGTPIYDFVQTEIYYRDDTYSYIDKSLFISGAVVYCSETGESLPVSMIGTLEGVYNVNRGYAVFRRIERLDENDTYVIIKKGTSSGVSVYDHIALDADLVTESSVIY